MEVEQFKVIFSVLPGPILQRSQWFKSLLLFFPSSNPNLADDQTLGLCEVGMDSDHLNVDIVLLGSEMSSINRGNPGLKPLRLGCYVQHGLNRGDELCRHLEAYL